MSNLTLKKQTYFKLLRYALFTGILYFVGKALITQLLSIDLTALDISWRFVLLSVFFEISARCLTGFGYERLLKYLSSPMHFAPAASIAWVSFLGKYLPGKVFLVAIAMYFFRRYKIRWEVATIVPLINTLMTISAALVLSLPVIYLFYEKLGLITLLTITAMIFLCGGIVLKPDLLFLLGKKYWIQLNISTEDITLSRSQIGICLCIAFFQCLCLGLSTWFVAKAFTPLETSTVIWFISITTFSNTIGLLAFFSPAGIGVKDGICFFAFSGIIGPEYASLITVIIRVLYTLMDIVSAGIGFLVLRFELAKS